MEAFNVKIPFTYYITLYIPVTPKRAQWLSGRVLDSRLRGRWFEPHRPHCVVVLEQDTFMLASTGSTQEDPSLFN